MAAGPPHRVGIRVGVGVGVTVGVGDGVRVGVSVGVDDAVGVTVGGMGVTGSQAEKTSKATRVKSNNVFFRGERETMRSMVFIGSKSNGRSR